MTRLIGLLERPPRAHDSVTTAPPCTRNTAAGCAPIGICGLLKRDVLADVDIGYALLPEFWSKGYALESASAVMAYASEKLGLKRVVAVTNSDNKSSIRLLEKMAFKYEKMVRLSEGAPEIKLFAAEV